jgi:NAD-dependent SIR2 family protein deacetylase
VIAACLAALVAWPFTILPLITGFTAAVVGVGAGLGTASGVKALRSGD